MTSDEHTLPRWAQRFLKTICPDYLLEEIEGDLLQKYQFDIAHYGEYKARRKLITNILRFLRPGILLRKKFSRRSNQSSMFRNYLLTTLRVSRRQRLYTFINILGLSVGLSASLLIGVYIADELSYDRHIVNADRIHRAGVNETFKGDEILYSSAGTPLADAMRRELPEVEDAVRFFQMSSPVRVGDRAFIEKKFMVADSNFFRFFGFALSEGNADKALKGPNKIVLSQSAAKKYFDYDGKNGESPVGKQMIVNRDNKVAEITGIYPDITANSHMKFDIVFSAESFEFNRNNCWGCYGFKTYFRIIPGGDMAVIEKKLEEFANEKIIPSIEKDLGISHEEFQKSGDIVKFFTQPLLSIHLESNIDGEFEPNGDIRYVYILGISGLFLIIIACINFMNLSTARAISRSKEVGVRKTMGATGRGLVPQFMMESLLYAIVSGVLAIVIAYLAIEPFSNMAGKELHLDLFTSAYVLPAIIFVLVIVGLLAGIYPSFYLSSFNPASVLKSGNAKASPKSIFRNSLVVFQFTISIVLIIGTLIIFRQLNYIQHHNLGFVKENVVRIWQAYLLGSNFQTFKTELLSHSEFSNASFASHLPPEIDNTGFIKVEGAEQIVSTYFFTTDYDFLKTINGRMKEGRFFSPDFLSDSSAIVLNASAARMLDFKLSEGKKITFGSNNPLNVVGVIDDFNFLSLKSDVQPLMFFLGKEAKGTMAIRFTAGNPAPKLELLQEIWKKHANGQALEYSFIDEDFDSQFRAEQRLGVVFAVFTSLAIFIACLGLFGLITYMAGQRMKEIGIRKVLGASASQVTVLLLSDLMKLVFISFVIAIPIAWYGMEQWLQSFAYRTNFDVMSVLIAGAAGILIAVVTVGYRSLRAAATNPVDVLKNE
jgi:putative ABC transport system permease protein